MEDKIILSGLSTAINWFLMKSFTCSKLKDKIAAQNADFLFLTSIVKGI